MTNLHRDNAELRTQVANQELEIKRLRAALEFYADPKNYDQDGAPGNAYWSDGEKMTDEEAEKAAWCYEWLASVPCDADAREGFRQGFRAGLAHARKELFNDIKDLKRRNRQIQAAERVVEAARAYLDRPTAVHPESLTALGSALHDYDEGIGK